MSEKFWTRAMRDRPKPAPHLDAATDADRLAVDRDTGDLVSFERWERVRALWLTRLLKKQFDTVLATARPELLSVDKWISETLEPVAPMTALTALDLTWATKVADLTPIAGLGGLEELRLHDFPKITDVAALRGLKNLRVLWLSGGMGDYSADLALESLAPLAALRRVETLTLTCAKAGDDSLKPLADMPALRRLWLSNLFPTEEIAWLAVNRPDVECELFAPFVDLGSEVMVTGKGKPFLNPVTQADRLARHIEAWEALIARYQAEALG